MQIFLAEGVALRKHVSPTGNDRSARIPGPKSLERDFVVEVGVAAGAGAGAGAGAAVARGVAGAAGEGVVVAAFHRAGALAPAAPSAVEHGQFTAEALQHHLGRVFLDPGVVGPTPGLQGALDINLGALAQVFLGDLDEPFVEDHHAVPLGALLALARDPVAPALRGRQVQIGDAHAVLGRADLGVAAEIADEDHLVDAASHGVTLGFAIAVYEPLPILTGRADVPNLFLSPLSTSWGRKSIGLQERRGSFETPAARAPQDDVYS